MSSHLSIALADFPNFDGISDKELFFVLEKYRCEKELDLTPIMSDQELTEIYKDAQDLNVEDLLDEEDDEF